MPKIYYSDGACSCNPGPGGWCAIELQEKNIVNIGYGYEDNTTNNRMELKAALYVLKLAKADSANEYVVYSDSAYTVNSINSWIPKWAQNGWMNSKKQEVENIDLMKDIYANYSKNFSICKVSGHSGLLGNELADAIATKNKSKINKIVLENNLSFDI